MEAMVLKGIFSFRENKTPLMLMDMPEPKPAEEEILIEVSACGVCHTELDEIEGRTPPRAFPVILGHQVVGKVAVTGEKATRFRTGERVGVGWIFFACGHCRACLEGNENVCNEFRGTGRDANGGYARFMTVSQDFAYPIPDIFSDVEAAPLLCAGAIGYRSLRLANLKDGQNLGLTGFGASAHLVLKMVRHKYPNSKVFVFARNRKEQDFARELGAAWAGNAEDEPPEKLQAIIDTTPAWKPIVEAMKNLESGGRLIINAIRKEEADKGYLLKINYPVHLWLEKEIKSVANVARRDISEFLHLAAEIPIKPEAQEFSLKEANEALVELKEARIRGAKVLRMD